MKVWLADLTYTQQTIASDFVPAAIGMISEYLESKIPSIPKTRLFKFPEYLWMQTGLICSGSFLKFGNPY